MPTGNSATIANAFLDTARESGANIKTFELYALNFSGCKACMACKTGKETCIIEDDLTQVLAAIPKTDVLVLAAPIYGADVNAAMKAFVERTHSFLGPAYGPLPGESRLAPGKKMVFVIAQGCPEDIQEDVYPKYKKFFGCCGFTECFVIRACDLIISGEIRKKPEILQQAKNLALEICRNEKRGD
jgi:multimeric flavodoxin WrbA